MGERGCGCGCEPRWVSVGVGVGVSSGDDTTANEPTLHHNKVFKSRPFFGFCQLCSSKPVGMCADLRNVNLIEPLPTPAILSICLRNYLR